MALSLKLPQKGKEIVYFFSTIVENVNNFKSGESNF